MRQVILAISLFIVAMCHGQDKRFTEEEFIEVVRKYHPIARQASLQVEMAATDVLSARGNFDPLFKARQEDKDVGGTTYYERDRVEISIPTWYGINITGGRESIQGDRVNPEETKGSLNYLEVSLPLLQNLAFDKRRAILRQAKVFRELSAVQQSSMLNDLFRDASKAYWEWWQQFDQHELVKEAVKNAMKRFQMVKSSYLLGDRPAIDTIEALTQVQSLEMKRIETSTALTKARLLLSTFLWTAENEQYDLPPDIIPQEWTAGETLVLESLLASSTLHPELLSYKYKFDWLAIDRKLKFQALLPELDVKYRMLGADRSQWLKTPFFEQDYRFGISLAFPLRLSEARGEYRKAKLKMANNEWERMDKQSQVINKVKRSFQDWEQAHAQFKLQHDVLTNVLALQRGEELRFSNGEGSLFLVNTRELRTIEAQQKLIELKSKIRTASIDLKWAAGISQNIK